MPLFNEKSLIEDYFVEQLQERSGKRWTFVSADDLERENLEEPLLTSASVRALKRLKIFENFRCHEGSKTRRKLDTDFAGCAEFFRHGLRIDKLLGRSYS